MNDRMEADSGGLEDRTKRVSLGKIATLATGGVAAVVDALSGRAVGQEVLPKISDEVGSALISSVLDEVNGIIKHADDTQEILADPALRAATPNQQLEQRLMGTLREIRTFHRILKTTRDRANAKKLGSGASLDAVMRKLDDKYEMLSNTWQSLQGQRKR